ncbi:MAG: GntR family transcriptional regulator [Deltaproteobacteria bacterium]|nr:GntR family transcriptional regulator [Deltaproteobacteria bacterium]
MPPLDLGLRSHKQAVYERLRDMIITFELAPGTRLVETEVAARFGVSKTPVREALLLLESDRLVEVAPYRGATVRWLSDNELLEQGFLVDALEMPAYPVVVERITDAELAAIGLVAEELRQARQDRDGLRFGKLASQIHSMLFACVRFPRLNQMIQMTLGPVGMRHDMALVYPYPDAWDALLDMALARVDAVRQRDAALAAHVVREHRENMRRMVAPRIAKPDVPGYWRND